MYALQIGASLCYKLGQLCLLQIRTNVVTNWGCYYKLRQPLLENRAAITNWAKNIKNWGRYFKLGWLLQIEA